MAVMLPQSFQQQQQLQCDIGGGVYKPFLNFIGDPKPEILLLKYINVVTYNATVYLYLVSKVKQVSIVQ